MRRSYFKLLFLFGLRQTDSMTFFFDVQDPASARSAYENLMAAKAAARTPCSASVWEPPIVNGPWSSLPVIGGAIG